MVGQKTDFFYTEEEKYWNGAKNICKNSWNGAKNACKKSWNGVILQRVKILEWCNHEKKDVSNPAEMEAGRTRQKGLDD